MTKCDVEGVERKRVMDRNMNILTDMMGGFESDAYHQKLCGILTQIVSVLHLLCRNSNSASHNDKKGFRSDRIGVLNKNYHNASSSNQDDIDADCKPNHSEECPPEVDASDLSNITSVEDPASILQGRTITSKIQNIELCIQNCFDICGRFDGIDGGNENGDEGGKCEKNGVEMADEEGKRDIDKLYEDFCHDVRSSSVYSMEGEKYAGRRKSTVDKDCCIQEVGDISTEGVDRHADTDDSSNGSESLSDGSDVTVTPECDSEIFDGDGQNRNDNDDATNPNYNNDDATNNNNNNNDKFSKDNDEEIDITNGIDNNNNNNSSVIKKQRRYSVGRFDVMEEEVTEFTEVNQETKVESDKHLEVSLSPREAKANTPDPLVEGIDSILISSPKKEEQENKSENSPRSTRRARSIRFTSTTLEKRSPRTLQDTDPRFQTDTIDYALRMADALDRRLDERSEMSASDAQNESSYR